MNGRLAIDLLYALCTVHCEQGKLTSFDAFVKELAYTNGAMKAFH